MIFFYKFEKWLAYSLSLLLFLAYEQASAQNYAWAKRVGGANFDYAYDMALDASGNVYTTGVFQGTVDFDPGLGVSNLTASGADIYVSKLDASGNFVWVKSMGGTNTEWGYSIALDASGNIYITGIFQGTADFDPGSGTTNLTSLGSRDIFVSKLDASGNLLWAKSMGGTTDDNGQSIAVDLLGNVYTTGYFTGTADFDPGLGTTSLISSGNNDIFVSKLDASGDFVWAKKIGGSSLDNATDISLNAAGEVHVVGYFSGTVDFDPGSGITNITSSGGNDVFLSKLDASGNFVFVKSMGGSSSSASSSGIVIDTSDNIFIIGDFSGTVDFDPGSGITDITGVSDIFITKLDASGNLLWVKSMGSAGSDSSQSIALDASGNIYTIGYFFGVSDYDPGAGTANLTSAGNGDVFISKLDALGNYVWAQSIGAGLLDNGIDIAVDALGNVYTLGYFQNTVDFDPSVGTANLTSSGNTDIFVSKLSPSLQYQTTGNVTFSSASGWESSPDGIAWSPATTIPNFNDLAITIQNGHTATVGANISLDELTVQSGGILQVNTSVTLTVADGTGTDLTVQGGGTIDVQGTGTLAGAGSFTLDAGGTFRTSRVNGFNAIGLTGTETFTNGANYVFNGTALQTINNPTGISANNFTINNSAGGKLSNALTITGTLATTLGDLDLNGFNVTLNGTLAEDRANNHIVTDNTAVSDAVSGGGIIFGATITDATGEIAGTGLYLQGATGANYPVTVTRKHYKGAVASRGGHGIKRIYQITGTPNQPTTMRIYYASDETAGVVGTYVLYRWQSGTGWKKATDVGSGFTNGTNGAGYVEATGINGFSHWTVGAEETPLPITLLVFGGERVEKGGEMTEEVRLEWSTASEINNKGFEVEMSEDGLAYQKIAFVEGRGNSTTVNSYQLAVINAEDGYYRLKQIDFDGTFSYSPVVFVEGIDALKVYPNPNNGTFTISGVDTRHTLYLPARLLNVVGKEVWRGIVTKVTTTGLPTGVYFLHTTVAGKTKITKVIIER